ncbi:MAG: precorrin-6A reductase, partial [Oscillospiraceae bacterium]|nr:precorrin-6A reductase [Oscillospiraceae bacterium]
MNDVILFAGTTEGRRITEALRGKNVTVHVSVATEYGETLIDASDNVRVMHGRKDAGMIASLIAETGASLVIDATHPYADHVTQTLRKVCAETGTEYLRVLRGEEREYDEGCVFVADTDEAVAFLDSTEGNIFLTVGSKELPRYAQINNAGERVFARILSLPEAMEQAVSLGFVGSHLIAMQGPFSEEINAAMLDMTGARYLVTKDTGATGGFPEKIRAARSRGVTPVVVRRPLAEEGVSVAECLSMLAKRFGFASEKKVTILGVGAGSPGSMTADAERACAGADLIIGAKRLIESLSRFHKPSRAAIAPAEIRSIIDESSCGNVVVAMSGDSGFYSGTKNLLPALADYAPTVLPGISSIQYFCSRTGESWDDAVLTSAHGRACNYVAKIKTEPKLIMLTGGDQKAATVIETLCENGLGDVSVTVGENLSYDNERITTGTAAELAGRAFDSLAVMLIKNPAAKFAAVTHGRDDADFARTEVPMSKQEVRAVTLSKLALTKSAVCWDVGAGTGSVSLEMAECAVDGEVYAVEQKENACELIEENKRRLAVTNVTVVCGKAPDALAELPAPTHVFIGGSSGNLVSIMDAALAKNPAARIVITAVT